MLIVFISCFFERSKLPLLGASCESFVAWSLLRVRLRGIHLKDRKLWIKFLKTIESGGSVFKGSSAKRTIDSSPPTKRLSKLTEEVEVEWKWKRNYSKRKLNTRNRRRTMNLQKINLKIAKMNMHLYGIRPPTPSFETQRNEDPENMW